MYNVFDATIRKVLDDRLNKLETHFNSDVVFYYGVITQSLEKWFRDFIEELKADEVQNRTLTILLNTPGGSAETVEKMVKVIRFHYDEVNFVIPDAAMSAGTIFCMSGDRIYMDYSSCLGPIDPQVYNGTNWVPALGYLDKVEELIKKSEQGTLSVAEVLMLQKVDLAELRSYEMAKELTVSLLKEWLVKYKFKTWVTHNTTHALLNQPVTLQQKEKRAEEIARDLGDNKIWHSHGRAIGIDALWHILRLKIEDYSNNDVLRPLIREYNDMICDYILRNGVKAFAHSRKTF